METTLRSVITFWTPKPAVRDPPVEAPDWPQNAVTPLAVIPLTYHPVPDIA
jgi:hypothetical protein